MIGSYTTSELGKYCAYTIHDAATFEPLYIDVDKIEDAVTMSKIKGIQNIDIDRLFTVCVLKSFNSLREAREYLRDLPVQSYAFNKIVAEKQQGKIRCVETGEHFETQIELSKHIGVTQSRISKHLKGLTGFKSIHGKTYIRCETN